MGVCVFEKAPTGRNYYVSVSLVPCSDFASVPRSQWNYYMLTLCVLQPIVFESDCPFEHCPCDFLSRLPFTIVG